MAPVDRKSYNGEIKRLMAENTTERFFIEYKAFLANHMSHGIRALQLLDAPLSTVNDFVSRYRKKLEPAERHRKREEAERDGGRKWSLAELAGAGRSYYRLYDHYSELLAEKYGRRVEALVRGEFAKLSLGLIGSALHGLIHLGYGLNSGLPWYVCEGLAYLHFSYTPLCLSAFTPDVRSLGRGDADIVDVLDELRNDAELIAFMRGQADRRRWHDVGHLQPRVGVLFTERGDALARYAHRVRFPNDLARDPLDPEAAASVYKWLVDSAIVTYAVSETVNDFFLLHGLTSAWALTNVLRCLTDVEQILRALRTFICALFAVYLAQDAPRLQRELLTDNDGLSYQWPDLINAAIGVKMRGDEHVYKVVQICWTMSKESKDESLEAIYRYAAHLCAATRMHI